MVAEGDVPEESTATATATPTPAAPVPLGIKDTISLDSLDAKIVQYHYASQKIIKFIVLIKDLIKHCQRDSLIPLSKYIVLLNGSIFNVNDNIYRRSEILINGNKFNPAQSIEPQQINTTAVNFDCMDNSTNYDTTRSQLPDFKKNLETLRLLELLMINTYEIYNNKLKYAMSERANLKQNDVITGKSTFSPEALYDLYDFIELKSVGSLTCTKPIEIIRSEEQIKSNLRSIDLKTLKLNVQSFQDSLDDLKLNIDNLLNCRKKDFLLSQPHFQLLMHRSLILLLHLADLYGIIRRFGKIIYLNNSFYFENYARTNDTLRVIMKNLEIYFNQSKKNNLLLAMITRMCRQGSIFQVKPDNILEIYKVCNDSYGLLNTMILVLKKLQDEWQNIIDSNRANEFDKDLLRDKLKQQTLKERKELREQNVNEISIAKKRLEAQYTAPDKNKSIQEKQSKLQKELYETAKEERLIRETELKEKEMNQAEDIKLKSEQREKTLRGELRSSPSGSGKTSRERSRSSSLVSSREDVIPPTSTTLNGNSGLRRGGSLRVPNPTTPISKKDSLVRRNSLIVQSSSSSTASGENSPLMNKRNSMIITPETKRTLNFNNDDTSSNSSGSSSSLQPISFPNPYISQSPSSALAGAAASVKLLNQQQKSEPTPSTNHITAAAIASRRSQQQQSQLTAQQRLQQHILKSSQNGQTIVKQVEKPVSKPIYKQKQKQQQQQQHNNNIPTIVTSPQGSRTNSLQSDVDVPSSPLNSMKQGSTIDQRSLQAQINRSRSNSAQSFDQPDIINNGNGNGNGNSNGRLTIPQQSQKIRSRSNSASQKPNENITNIPEHEQIESISSPIKFPSGNVSVNVSDGSNQSSASSSRPRSRSSSVKLLQQQQQQQQVYKPLGNTIVYDENDNIESTNTEISIDPETGLEIPIVKKVRFCNVPEYTEDEDAPTPQQMQKQMRQKWSLYKPQFRNRTKLLNSQEGLAFRKLQNSNGGGGGGGGIFGNNNGEFEGFSRNHQNQIPVDSNGKFSMMSVINSPNGNNEGQKRLTKLFKRR
ncbi:hypothetical protein CANARDRAFT_30473 [[Candida] arabinofermentans NRRL YB-2248]|uniref:Uncharacterized protein n=1 Tax=[Candida] arabinofermentans NRRL YB-2248 TaxID=983967 RepID=A0A1E4STS3_9ASCO|nr:hypothetical protein CANARDRAFT_30473 [[Candida] arabinofermentans NRRL YB-2248]